MLDDARDDLAHIDDWLAEQASPAVADRFTQRILRRLDSLVFIAERGTIRAELPGLRVIGILPRISVAFVVTEDTVLVQRILYGGQDWQASLSAEED